MTPPSSDEAFVFAQLAKNLENACIKVRRHGLAATRLIVFLRTQDFRHSGAEMKLSRATAYPSELFGPLREGFGHAYRTGVLYRQTGVVLAGLLPEGQVQHTLFDDMVKVERTAKLYDTVDKISQKFGKHTLQHAASLPTKLEARHKGERGDMPERMTGLFRGENQRQRLGLPVWRVRV